MNITIYSFVSFSHHYQLIVLLGSLRDSKSSQISRTLLSILADLNDAVVWVVSTCALISKSSSPFTNRLGIVPSATTTIGITVTFMFHSSFSSLGFRYLLFLLCGLPGRQSTLFGSFSFFVDYYYY